MVWQVGYTVLRFAVMPSGAVTVTGKTPQHEFTSLSATVHQLTIAPGVPYDLEMDAKLDVTDSYNVVHHWILQGRMVGQCPQ